MKTNRIRTNEQRSSKTGLLYAAYRVQHGSNELLKKWKSIDNKGIHVQRNIYAKSLLYINYMVLITAKMKTTFKEDYTL